MLLSFRFANHRSFRDEQQLNLTPVYDGPADTEQPPQAVPVVGIFGANASGKSNVISAFRYLSDMVGRSDREVEPGIGPERKPFLLDPVAEEAPSSYAADLMIDGVRHTYGFTLDDTQVTEEWLYSYPLRRKRIIFERSGENFFWGEESAKSSIRKLPEITSPSALFLSVAARFQVRQPSEDERDSTSASLQRTYSWLWLLFRFNSPQIPFTPSGYSPSSAQFRRLSAIEEILKAADVGLEGIRVQTPEDDELGFNIPQDYSIKDRERVLRHLRERRTTLRFLHRGSVGGVTLAAGDESSGTLRLLDLASAALTVLESGGVLLIDEIDASLHPLLTATLVKLFQSSAAQSRSAQLIFTSHDATLLGSIDGEDVLDRDQVWFTSKGRDGASELFPLSDFKPRRKGENRQKRYLTGSYGAIPELSMRLFEQALTSRTDQRAD